MGLPAQGLCALCGSSSRTLQLEALAAKVTQNSQSSGRVEQSHYILQSPIDSIDDGGGRELSGSGGYILFKKSVISGAVQSTAPMNLRRITPLRSMM